jgi:hypothetical protein
MLIKTLRTSFLQVTTMLSLAALLTACGGGSGSQLENTIKGSSSSTASSSSSVDTTQVRDLGRGSGDDFVSGEIEVGIGTNTLSAGGVTTLTVNVVSGSNNLITESLDVTFNSRCVARQESLLSAAKVTTTNGEATTTYTANGCVGADEITATATYNGAVLAAKATLNVAEDTIGSVQYIDATPVLLSIKGTGGPETSSLRFRVLGATEAPIKDVEVSFKLNTTVGGLSLVSSTAKTDSAGNVTAIVKSGTISTSVRVTATALAVGLSAQSSELIVSTGIPDQKSMSLSVSTFSPAAWNYDGTTVDFTVRLADAFNNLAPDGTAVYFTTEGGAIDSGCTTTDGGCSATWRSQEPRPNRGSGGLSMANILCTNFLDLAATDGNPRNNKGYRTCAAERAGRITVLATALGNESFVDTNGNGYYDSGIDIFRTSVDGDDCDRNAPTSSAEVATGSPLLACDDLTEAYLDKNESGSRDRDEYFVDFNNNQTHDFSDEKYNGVLCIPPANFETSLSADARQSAWESSNNCTKNGVTIRKEAVIVMACDRPLLDVNNRLPGQPSALALGAGESESISLYLADCNGNGLPAGTTVTLNTSNSTNITANHSLTGPLPSSIEWTTLTVNLKASDNNPATGTILINVSVPTPSGELITTTRGILML